MRIWIINYYTAPPTRAGNTRHHHLARELIERGNQVLLVGASSHHLTFETPVMPVGNGGLQEEVEGVPYFWIPTPLRGEKRAARFINWLIFAWKGWRLLPASDLFRPDVIIGSTPSPFGALLAQRCALKLSAPFVYEVRDLWPLTLQELGGYRSWNPIIWLLGRLNAYLVRRASLIVSLLSGAEDYFSQNGLPPRKVVWIPNGVDLELAGSPRRLRDSPERVRVVYAGNLGFSNALDSLFECARILAERGHADRFVFRFLGAGTEKKRLVEKASRLELGNVVFDDPVPKTRVFQELAKADVLVATLRKTQLYRHGMSLSKVFDYLAAGKPIVFGGDALENPVRLAGAGIVVPPEDPTALAEALLTIRGLPVSEREEMGRRGREYAERHCSYTQRADELEKGLQAVLASLHP